MAACQIERTLEDVEAALAHAKSETIARGGVFDGDEAAGSFVLQTPLGAIEGSYAAHGTAVVFVVSKKPWLVSCALIAQVLDEFLARKP
jgi:hypothetical protein